MGATAALHPYWPALVGAIALEVTLALWMRAVSRRLRYRTNRRSATGLGMLLTLLGLLNVAMVSMAVMALVGPAPG